MLANLAAEVGTAISLAPVAASSLSDVFEVYVFCLVARAARQEGATVLFVDRASSPVTELVFRTSPGNIYSSKDYTHGLIEFPGKAALELHIGVKVAGKSGVLHEIDVSVLDRAEAESCRLNFVAPRSNRLLIAIECKFYSSALQLHLARGYLGLVSDVSAGYPTFVTNTSSVSVEKLLSHRARNRWEKNVSPACKNTEVDRLVHYFRQAFKDFKAR